MKKWGIRLGSSAKGMTFTDESERLFESLYREAKKKKDKQHTVEHMLESEIAHLQTHTFRGAGSELSHHVCLSQG